MDRRAFHGSLAATLLALSTPVRANTWPDRPLRFITTSAAGSPLDAMMRALGKELGDLLKQSVVVENRPGGTGAIGMNLALNSPADGYTVVSATGSTSFLMAEPQARFGVDDFIFLRAMQTEPSSIAVRANSPYRTMGELIEALKRDASAVNIGGFAVAGFHQYVLYRLEQVLGFSATWVPFQGGNQALMALMGGHLDVAIMTPSTGIAQLNSGEIRLLGISSAERTSFFPDVPTFKEQGFDVVETLWRGVMVAKGTPAPVVDRLVAELKAVEKSPTWKRFMQDNRQDDLPMEQADFQAFVAEEVKHRRTFLASIKR